MTLKKFSFTMLLISISIVHSFAQWNPVSSEESFLVSNRQTQFFIMSGAAVGSLLLTKFLSKNPKLDYVQGHIAYFNGDGYDVYMQNFGVERAFAPWFALRVEGNIQEFTADNYSTIGLGLRNYTRWSILGKKKLSPYFEYGAGIFSAIQDLSTVIEVTLNNDGSVTKVNEFTVSSSPSGLFAHADGSIYVLTFEAIYQFDTDGTQLCAISIPDGLGMTRPDGIYIDSNNEYIYLADSQGPLNAGHSMYKIAWTRPCD